MGKRRDLVFEAVPDGILISGLSKGPYGVPLEYQTVVDRMSAEGAFYPYELVYVKPYARAPDQLRYKAIEWTGKLVIKGIDDA